MIEVYDNFLNLQDFLEVVNYCKNSFYKYGEVDRDDTPPTGMISDLSKENLLLKNFNDKIRKEIIILKELSLYRSYINCFSPNEDPYFHTDNNSGFTCLYYANEKWNLDDGGETQFLINDEIKGVLPIPNRLVCFDANILHKATSFRNNYRFTIAFKYE